MIRMAELQIGDEERAAVMAVLDSGQLAAGPVTQRVAPITEPMPGASPAARHAG